MDNDLPHVNRSLLKELVELRQMRSERESILRTNQYYIAQVSQMEIKISELKANLQAKESEINYLKQNITETEEKFALTPFTNRNQEEQILLLEAENEHLRKQLQEAGEISQLRIQLEHAIRMKETFEEKYREAKTLLLTNRGSNSIETFSETEYVRKETFLKLQDELERSKTQLSQFQNQCNILSAENEELLRKNDFFEKEFTQIRDKFEVSSVKSRSSTVRSMNLDITKPHASPVSSDTEINKCSIRTGDPLSTKSSSYANIAKSTRLNNSRVAKSAMLPLPKQPMKNEIVEYCPSFMRNKKFDMKVTPTPSMKKNSLNSFADDFPEEVEF